MADPDLHHSTDPRLLEAADAGPFSRNHAAMRERKHVDGRPAVLLVEDEKLLLDVLRQVFEEAEFTVMLAETGDHAATILQSGQAIDLLVTDIRLPGQLTGWDVAEQARKLYPALSVIYATAYNHETPRPVSGAVLIAKPYRPSALKKVVRKFGFVS